MSLKVIAIFVAVAVFSMQMVSAQSVVCTAPQVANYSGAKLVGIVGNIGWVYSYYNFTGFSTAQIISPSAINYTKNSAPGSSYLLYADYRFSGPSGLTASPAVVFVLSNNTEQGCSTMKLFAYSGVVAPYSTAKLITAQQATSAAQKEGYNITFGQPLTLVPMTNQTGIQMLVPGYSSQSSNYTVYAYAENGTISSTGTPAVSSSPSSGTGLLSGAYTFFEGIIKWVSGLLGQLKT